MATTAKTGSEAIVPVSVEREVKPLLRGWFHLGALPVVALLGLVLVALAEGPVATWSSVVFAISSLLMFGTSASYHRIEWTPTARAVLKRLDHANIFVLIAGTYTPLGLSALPWSEGQWLLTAVWIGAGLGIVFRVFWLGAPRWLYVPLYLALGWASVWYMPQLFAANVSMTILVIVGGIAYSAGAVIYGMKRPNPVPGVFGFHEIFHVLTVVAFLCHWTAVLLIAIEPVNR
ncbi:MAG: hemolysin III family protein [Microbacteriaceae bacterium]|nr:hemolysin III family protein [Microbacteriaceae bacterium]